MRAVTERAPLTRPQDADTSALFLSPQLGSSRPSSEEVITNQQFRRQPLPSVHRPLPPPPPLTPLPELVEQASLERNPVPRPQPQQTLLPPLTSGTLPPVAHRQRPRSVTSGLSPPSQQLRSKEQIKRESSRASLRSISSLLSSMQSRRRGRGRMQDRNRNGRIP